jgi:hypothetical protein
MIHRGLPWRVLPMMILRNQFRVGGGGLVVVGSKAAGARLTGTTGTIPTANEMMIAVVVPCCAFVRVAFVTARIPRTPF